MKFVTAKNSLATDLKHSSVCRRQLLETQVSENRPMRTQAQSVWRARSPGFKSRRPDQNLQRLTDGRGSLRPRRGSRFLRMENNLLYSPVVHVGDIQHGR